MIRLYLLYGKSIIVTNCVFSFLLSLIAFPLMLKPVFENIGFPAPIFIILAMIKAFTWSFLTGGFLISVLFFEIRKKNEYYFYYNISISKPSLLLSAYMLHLIFITPLLIVLFNV